MNGIVPNVPFGQSNHQHALDLIKLIMAEIRWYQAVKVTYRKNGQVESVEIGWDRGAVVVVGIVTVGVIFLVAANPVVLTSFNQLVQYCITQFGSKAVIAKIGSGAIAAAGVVA